ncbi:MAG: translesion DNA synthesis-associated protein ImuA [Pseudohongiellaceae bacterium]
MTPDLFANPSSADSAPDALQQLLVRQPRLRRGADHMSQHTDMEGLPSGFTELDALLPWQGWPERGLVEIVQSRPGMGELQLLMPLLRHFSRQEKPVLMITPPHELYAPALVQAGIDTRHLLIIRPQDRCQQALWSTEKVLQSHECALVLVWQNWLGSRVIRRLQLAASQGGTPGFLFHHKAAPHSPATLQMQLDHARGRADGRRTLSLQVLKARSCHCRGAVEICLDG